MVSLEGLTKVVDPSQLTPEFDGCLEYNHEEWIEIRLAFEDYISNATHMLSRLEELQDILAKKELPQDLEGARNMIEEHSQLKKKVIKAPIEDLDLEGQKLLQRIQSSESFPKKNSGSGNADLQSLLPKVSAMLDRLHSTRQHLHQMWHVRKLKLDQCFQLRLFEQDAEKVAEGAGVLPCFLEGGCWVSGSEHPRLIWSGERAGKRAGGEASHSLGLGPRAAVSVWRSPLSLLPSVFHRA